MVMAVGPVALPDPGGTFKERQEADYLASLVSRISSELGARPRDDSARVNVLMQSPSGKIFSVYVADDGTVASALVHG